jgi:hypothetical protein
MGVALWRYSIMRAVSSRRNGECTDSSEPLSCVSLGCGNGKYFEVLGMPQHRRMQGSKASRNPGRQSRVLRDSDLDAERDSSSEKIWRAARGSGLSTVHNFALAFFRNTVPQYKMFPIRGMDVRDAAQIPHRTGNEG